MFGRIAGRAAQRGLSLIEMMVGIVVGMIVVAGASLMMVTQIGEHRRLMLETQIQQDLRAVADLVLRDLRRAGYWENSQNGILVANAVTPAASNPYLSITPAITQTEGSSVEYSYTRDSSKERPENNLLDTNEVFGFKLDGEVLKFRLGDSGWQPLTDPETLIITGFNVASNVQSVPLDTYCPACTAGSTTCPPELHVRSFTVTVSGEASHDRAVRRTLTVNSRVRNDSIVGTCP